MTRQRKLHEVLNLRLDAPLAQEIARIAAAQGRSESEIARTLLSYGIEVTRRLEALNFTRAFSWQAESAQQTQPGVVEIYARWRPQADDEHHER